MRPPAEPTSGQDAIEKTNWLAHRWPVTLETFTYGQWLVHVGKVEGHRIGQQTSRAEYESWLAEARPMCLARFVAERPALHPAMVVVFAGSYRLGRIPPELWCGYDVTHLKDEAAETLLSARVRAMFPAWPGALIRVVPESRVGTLHLQPAPDPRGARLRLVG